MGLQAHEERTFLPRFKDGEMIGMIDKNAPKQAKGEQSVKG